MQSNPGPQPERFQVYTELQDGSGFTIKDSEHVYYFDKYGGWQDQYGNYYNENGTSQPKPEYSSDSESEKSISQGSWSCEEDEYQKLFAPNYEVQDEFQKKVDLSEAQVIIAKNLQILDEHIKKDMLRVNFKILGLQPNDQVPTQKQMTQQYRKKVSEIINVFFETDAVGYFVVKNVTQAVKLINLEGENIVGCDVTFDVQSFQQLRNDPLSIQQTQQKIPKFVQIDQNTKVYTIHLENHTGIINKEIFTEWRKNAKKQIPQFQILKMRANQKKQKIPIVKISQKNIQKLKNIPFGDKKVTVQEYKPIYKHTQQLQTEKSNKETGATEVQQKIQQKVEQKKYQENNKNNQ